jgi:hypothetical protein
MGLPRSGNLRAIGICAAIAVGASLGILAPPAMAAPANDQFANRTDLGDALPVHVEESNSGATPDAGERISDFAKGHSIWWEWEAPVSGWTTVSTCGSNFATVVNVFEGTELGHLTSLTEGGGNGDEGPACFASQTTYTFRATQGHDYEIGADGNAFYAPPLPGEEADIPAGEGEIKLSIEATPPPPNDDFADAISIDDSFRESNPNPFEEPNDDRYYWGEVDGYNWGATGQAGESEHAGSPGGASVWYSWTPSESGDAWISLQTPGGPKLLALYKGSSLAGLVTVGSSPGPSSAFWADVEGGAQYRIAVDGAQSGTSGEPSMGSFALGIEMKVAPAPWDLTAESTVVPAPIAIAPTSSSANSLRISPEATSTSVEHRRKAKKRRHQRRHRAHHRAARHHRAG